MKNGELKEYLNTFQDDAEVEFLLANLKERKLYEHKEIFVITDLEMPIFCIEVEKTIEMDEKLVKACDKGEKEAEEIDGQMVITDFPEVLP